MAREPTEGLPARGATCRGATCRGATCRGAVGREVAADGCGADGCDADGCDADGAVASREFARVGVGAGGEPSLAGAVKAPPALGALALTLTVFTLPALVVLPPVLAA